VPREFQRCLSCSGGYFRGDKEAPAKSYERKEDRGGRPDSIYNWSMFNSRRTVSQRKGGMQERKLRKKKTTKKGRRAGRIIFGRRVRGKRIWFVGHQSETYCFQLRACERGRPAEAQERGISPNPILEGKRKKKEERGEAQ